MIHMPGVARTVTRDPNQICTQTPLCLLPWKPANHRKAELTKDMWWNAANNSLWHTNYRYSIEFNPTISQKCSEMIPKKRLLAAIMTILSDDLCVIIAEFVLIIFGNNE